MDCVVIVRQGELMCIKPNQNFIVTHYIGRPADLCEPAAACGGILGNDHWLRTALPLNQQTHDHCDEHVRALFVNSVTHSSIIRFMQHFVFKSHICQFPSAKTPVTRTTVLVFESRSPCCVQSLDSLA